MVLFSHTGELVLKFPSQLEPWVKPLSAAFMRMDPSCTPYNYPPYLILFFRHYSSHIDPRLPSVLVNTLPLSTPFSAKRWNPEQRQAKLEALVNMLVQLCTPVAASADNHGKTQKQKAVQNQTFSRARALCLLATSVFQLTNIKCPDPSDDDYNSDEDYYDGDGEDEEEEETKEGEEEMDVDVDDEEAVDDDEMVGEEEEEEEGEEGEEMEEDENDECSDDEMNDDDVDWLFDEDVDSVEDLMATLEPGLKARVGQAVYAVLQIGGSADAAQEKKLFAEDWKELGKQAPVWRRAVVGMVRDLVQLSGIRVTSSRHPLLSVILRGNNK